MTVRNASGVYSSEVDLSQIIRSQAATIGAIVAASKRGPLGPTLITVDQDVENVYGPGDVSVSYLHQAAKEYLSVANQLYINRVVGEGYAYSGVLLQNLGTTGSRTLSLFGVGSTGDPSNVDFAAAGSADELDDNLCYFYAIGPGVFYNNYRIGIKSDNIQVPSGIAVTPSDTGGALAAGSYSYRVSALGKLGETLASTAANASVSVGVTTGKNTITWNKVPGAVGYRIYGRAAGAEELMGSVNAGVLQFVDDGSVETPAGSVPASSYTPTNIFVVEVYDASVNTSIPVEAWEVSLEDVKDGFNQQLEIEQVINTNSKYVRVVSNAKFLTEGIPTITPLDPVSMAGGGDGAAVTDADVIEGWDAFADRDQIRISVMINAGYATPAIHSKMNAIAVGRKDCVALLDVPSNKQSSVDAIAYRRLEANINSSRCALFTPDLEILDPDSRKLIYAPPSGFVAARIAFTDFTTNPGRSPAGLNRGVLPNVTGQRINYSKGDQELLATNQVNYFKSVVGRGTYLNEQLTMQAQLTAVSFLSVRRIFDVIELSVEEALEYSLHEQNDDFTRDQIVSLITEFCENLRRTRNINNFTIVADTRNNPNYVRGSGQLNVDVYIEPTLPINKIQLRTIITKQGANFEELIAA